MKKFMILILVVIGLGVSLYSTDTALQKAEKVFELGVVHYKGKNYDKAGKLFKKACDDGNIDSCYSLGGMYYKGKGKKQDYVKAGDIVL